MPPQPKPVTMKPSCIKTAPATSTKHVSWSSDVYVTVVAETAYKAATQGVQFLTEENNPLHSNTSPNIQHLQYLNQNNLHLQQQMFLALQTSPGALTQATQRATRILTTSLTASQAVPDQPEEVPQLR